MDSTSAEKMDEVIMSQKVVSIIIVTYNSERDIYDCVRSIVANADVPRECLELVVVDNCSREPEAMFAQLRQLWGEDAVLIRNTKNGGYGQGNNVGLRAASAPMALIMNPDVRLVMPVFQRAAARFEADGDLAVMGLKQMTSANRASTNSICCDWLMNGYLRPVISALANRFDWFWPRRMYVQGSCFFVRRSMFESVGMFDEEHFMYGEEEDIHYRLQARYGASCYAYDKGLRYIHQTEDRAPSLAYEKRIVEANVSLYRKKGVASAIILNHFLQNLRFVMLRDRCFGTSREQRAVNEQLKTYLQTRLKEEK